MFTDANICLWIQIKIFEVNDSGSLTMVQLVKSNKEHTCCLQQYCWEDVSKFYVAVTKRVDPGVQSSFF